MTGLSRAFALAALLALAACGPEGPLVGNRPPVAAFGVEFSGTTVVFDGRASFDPDGDALAYAWAFGDGGVAAGPIVTHTYGEVGGFVASLTVTDARGASGVASRVLGVGRLSGALEVRAAGAGAGGPLAPRAPAFDPDAASFVPGEVLVLFRDGAVPPAAELAALGIGLARVRDLALPGAALYRLEPGVSAAGSDRVDATWALVAALRARPDVVDAQPNYLLQPTRVPDDPLYPLQWHYRAIGLEEAWDLTVGAPSVVVAVLDTGILHDPADAARSHRDFAGQVLPGYDFISDPLRANDGDGRDPDPYDPGDEPGGQSSYHGSHVAGTVAAASDDGYGAAGVAWSSRILPVRVLGVGGGELADILDGLAWAAGLPVAGVPANPHPAQVANLSLGGRAPCSSVSQAFVDAVLAAGTTVVVAAGNEAANAADSFPANCAGVVAVGATNAAGERAWYSNHGSRIDLMAPGGDLTFDALDGVVSAWRDDATGVFGHAFAQGTSMAAPHVAGVMALMLALDPTLSSSQLLALLTATARPLTAAECTADHGSPLPGSACGAGLIDAGEALAGVLTGPPPSPGTLAFDPGFLDFGASTVERLFTMTNGGGGDVAWFIGFYDPAFDNPGPVEYGAVYIADGSPQSGTLPPGGSVDVVVGIDRSFVPVPGTYRFDLIIEENGAERLLPVRFVRPIEGGYEPSGTTYVAAYRPDGAGDITLHGLRTYPSPPSGFDLLSMAGEVRVLVWTDENGNGQLDDGDFVGEHPGPVVVAGGQTVSGVDVVLDPVFGITDAAASIMGRLAEAGVGASGVANQ